MQKSGTPENKHERSFPTENEGGLTTISLLIGAPEQNMMHF